MIKNNTTITFRDFIAIAEAKQVGTIYHFTRLSSLFDMIKFDFDMSSHQDYISFTRNYNMIDYEKNQNDLAYDFKLGDKRIVRIAIDGDKLSNKYKIEPFLDITNNVKRSAGEQEQRIKQKLISIKCCIKQIDIIDADSSTHDKIQKDIKDLGYNNALNFATLKKLKKVK